MVYSKMLQRSSGLLGRGVKAIKFSQNKGIPLSFYKSNKVSKFLPARSEIVYKMLNQYLFSNIQCKILKRVRSYVNFEFHVCERKVYKKLNNC